MESGWAELEFDRRASTYDQSSLHRELAAAVARFAAPASSELVLDVATGTGLVLRELGGIPVSQLTGIDVSSGMLAAATATLPGARFVRAEASQLPFAAGEFDLITCVSALPYLGDPATALREWRRVLRDDGRIVVSAFAIDGMTGPTLVRRAAAVHGLVVEDPNESTATLTAWLELGEKVGLSVARHEVWSTTVAASSVESLLATQYPLDVRNDLATATVEQLALVGATLTGSVVATPRWQAEVLFVELRLDD